MDTTQIGRWAYVAGLILSVVLGWYAVSGATTILIILGLVVGFLNIGEKESTSFLVAVIALMLVGLAGTSSIAVAGTGDTLVKMFDAFVSFSAAAALVVGIKQVVSLAK